MSERNEAGVAPQRIEFVRETTPGETPSNPAWNLYSDAVQAWWDWEPDANVEATRAAGSPDPVAFPGGAESHDATISYHLQQWFVDGSGNAQDASADAMLLSADNGINNTHSVVSREEHASGGAADAGRRIYHVGKGGRPGNVTVPFETDSGTPPEIELGYMFEKMRVYSISQPSGSLASSGTVESTSANDTSQTLTLEDEGAATTEDIALNGTTAVTITSAISDIDAAELDAQTEGNVIVKDGNGNTLLTIYGQNEYPHGEGDLGVPALGTGSHAAALGTDYVTFLDDDIPHWDGSDVAAEFISGELSVDLNLDDNSVAGTPRRNIHTTGRTTTWSATIAGAAESVQSTYRYLTGKQGDYLWTAQEGTVTGPNARYMSPGSSGLEPEQGKHQRDIELESEGLTIA